MLEKLIRWYSPDECLPEKSCDVMIQSGSFVAVMSYSAKYQKFNASDYCCENDHVMDVDRWAYLPELPPVERYEPAEGIGTNMSEAEYQRIADDDPPMSEEMTLLTLHSMFSFDMNRIKIVQSVCAYRKNADGEISLSGKYSRLPVWAGAHWNYIRFDTPNHKWEVVNGELMPYNEYSKERG